MSHGIVKPLHSFVFPHAIGALLIGVGVLLTCGCGEGPRKAGPKLGAVDVKQAQKVNAKGKPVEAAPEPAPPAKNNNANSDPDNSAPNENTEPAATEPAATEPDATEPATTEPATAEPATTDSATTDSTTSDLGKPNQANTEAVDIIARLEKLNEEQGIGAPVILITEVGKVLTQDVANALAQNSSNPLETFINARANAANKLDTGNIKKAMKALRAAKGRPPRTIKEFVAGFKEMECMLPELESGEFYVYDPKKATQEANDDDLEYLTIFKN